MKVKVWFPGDLDPAAGVMLGPAQVGGNEESLILREELGTPLGTEGIGGIDKTICGGAAAGQEERADLVLTIPGFDSRTSRKPVAGAAFNCPRISANRVPNHETFVCIAVQILAIGKEVIWTEIFG